MIVEEGARLRRLTWTARGKRVPGSEIHAQIVTAITLQQTRFLRISLSLNDSFIT
ncbi:hypothetical protein ACIP97_04000 [Peribacillus frigoritolerans]|uniref:hypothetical protein n=1 Tax=Peribacillus frigoritolerans TaxID=450367 RepID=UPI00381CE0DE